MKGGMIEVRLILRGVVVRAFTMQDPPPEVIPFPDEEQLAHDIESIALGLDSFSTPPPPAVVQFRLIGIESDNSGTWARYEPATDT